jgi:transposase-like protein
MANNGRDPQREARWRGLVAQQAECGLTARAFCRRENLAESVFYFWRRTIRERDGLSAPAKSRLTHDKSSPRPAFVPAVVTSALRREDLITIELGGGRLLRLPPATSTATLVDLVVSLEAAPAGRSR